MRNIEIIGEAVNKINSVARQKPDAVKFATDARAMSELINGAVATGKWDDVKSSAGTLGQQCQSCHGTYRERFDDGSFRIKASSK